MTFDELLADNNKKIRRQPSYPEQHLQMMCVEYLFWQYNDILYHHSPNEAKRDLKMGDKLKKMGMRKGWPDLEIMHPSGGYYGLFIEFKSEKGSTSKEQKAILAELERQGYKVAVIKDIDEFISVVDEYIGTKEKAYPIQVI